MHITIHSDHNIEIKAENNQSLAQAIWLSGNVNPRALCSGLGRCGQCKVKFVSKAPKAKQSEQNLLSPQEIEQGYRLACRHHMAELTNDLNEHIEIALQNHSATSQNMEVKDLNAQSVKLAIDLGTTSLHWQAISCNDENKIIAKGQQINPQMGAGSDIISRLAFAMQTQGEEKLATLVYSALQNIIAKLPPVDEICLAANTAMTAIFLQKPIQSLAMSPYALPFSGHSQEHVPNFAPIYIPVQLAPFVGGDISAGYAAILQQENLAFPFIFVDLGTNGEFVLAMGDNIAYITSVPLGPALEGIGLTFGQMANNNSKGIVYTAHLSPKGLEPKTIDGGIPERICGTGYLSIMRCLLQADIIQANGHFNSQENIKNPLGQRLYHCIEQRADEKVLNLWPHINSNPMYISSGDIEEILKVKAAFSLAMQELLAIAKLKPAELKNIYLGGAMGSYVQGEDLEALGFIPYGMHTRLARVGNSALAGAALLLTDTSKRQWLYEWSKNIAHTQLAERDNFIQEYMKHMHFKYTD